jgi:crossover junction endodeoxyribonuclease RusA
MVSISLTLPLPPSINNQYVTAGRRRVLSKDARAFKKDVRKLIEAARLKGTIQVSDEQVIRESLLGIYLTFHFETPFRRDLDGGLKIALDAVCEALDVDDRMVVDLHLTKQIDPRSPRLELELEVIESWTFDPQYVLLATDPEIDSDAEHSVE